MPRFIAALGVGLLVAACATFPEIEAVPAATKAPPPELLPIDLLLAEAGAGAAAPPALSARAARLKARAALMRGDVLDPATRARLAKAAQNGAG